ncbi:dipeptidase [Sphingosinicella rhizophila]|uniref:Membrane dipeptidase n=1 Tax=Sphingosinicella rhizophila TaxID=3050082 RepID=A0ABU3Q9U6_9SPHN|nr:membrane dipeptidase [Sphingosinicella sp. GR2756]MDT9600087.1 membrane dipeptidase [Sphingosinicella sp. GR2756]
MNNFPHVNRRHMLAGGAAAAAAVALTPGMAFAAEAYSARARQLIDRSLVIDMLAVLRMDFAPDVHARPMTPTEIADWRASGINVLHNAIGIGGRDARTETLEFIAAWSGFVGRNAGLFSLIGTVADMDRAKAEKKIGVIIGLQNSEHFRDADDVKVFHRLGQRCSQLTYNSQNMLASGSTERVDGGVTDFGVSIIKAMNEVGMLVDVSHSGDRTTLDAIAISEKPIAFTHSNCRALTNHPRTKTDEAIKALAARGGVMGITGVRNFVKADEPTDISHMVNHIDHVVQLVGIDHVGIGSDADLYGYDDMPADQYKALKAGYKSSYAFRDKIDTDGYDHPRKNYNLVEELIRRKYSDADIQKVLGGNFRRLLTTVWGG